MTPFYELCQRCWVTRAAAGTYCLNCAAKRHVWEGTAHHATCRLCGAARHKKRKRTYPGQQGSMWQTWYNVDPATGEKPNEIPLCK